MGARPLTGLMATAAGAVDAIGVLVLGGLFTAHMSGNTARLGLRLGRGLAGLALPIAVAVVAFAASIAAASLLAEAATRAGRRPSPPLLALEALLLAGFTVTGGAARTPAPSGSLLFYALMLLAVGSMGVQTAAVLRIAGRRMRTTYISGTLTRLAQLLAAAVVQPQPDGYLHHVTGATDRRGALAAAGDDALVVAGYLAGAVAGTFAELRIDAWAAALPFLLIVLALALTAAVHG